MPLHSTIAKAQKDKRQGKSPSTQAGEFVHESIDQIRKGKHGARSAKQAIAIGLSEARRAGVKVSPKPGSKSTKTVSAKAGIRKKPVSAKRSQAITRALKREPTSTVSPRSLSQQAKSSAAKRSPAKRRQAAVKAAHTRRHESAHPVH